MKSIYLLYTARVSESGDYELVNNFTKGSITIKHGDTSYRGIFLRNFIKDLLEAQHDRDHKEEHFRRNPLNDDQHNSREI